MDVRPIACAWKSSRISSAICTGASTSRTTCCFRARSRSSTVRGAMTEPEVRDALREVIDPELGINIVDLGLVYRIDFAGDDIVVTMTMTTPACPMRDYMQDLVQSTLA